MTTVNVKGLKELNALLQSLPVKVEKNILRGAMRAGANVVKNEAKLLAPVGNPSGRNATLYGGYRGALRDSIRVSGQAKGGNVIASVKAGGKTKAGADVYYAHMVEYGTKPHVIEGPVVINGVFVGDISHPGTSPRPFMRPALDSKSGAAVVAAGDYIKKRLATKEGLNTADITIEEDE